MRVFYNKHVRSTSELENRFQSADRAKRLAEAKNISRRYVLLASMLALIPVPLIDLAAVLSLQVKLVQDLAKLYNIPFQSHIVRPLFSSVLSGCAVTSGGVLLIAIGKAIPGLGTLVGGGLTGSLAGSTLATSEIFIRHFEAGGTLRDFPSSPTDPSAKTEPATDTVDLESSLEISVSGPSDSGQTDEKPAAEASLALTSDDGIGPAPQQDPTLEEIYGIGPVYVSRLKSSGINDLKTLVNLEANVLRQILGTRVSLATANDFLSQARALIQANTS